MRKSREEADGAVHHLFAHGIDANPIFRDFEDRIAYLGLLERTVKLFEWNCMAFCLMTTHVHLLVQTPVANLGEGMQWFHCRYATRFNRRHGRRGHLFEARFGSVPVKTDPQLKVVAAYIVNNPVAAGLCETAEQHPWSSHDAVLRGRAPAWLATDLLLGYFGAAGGDPLERYRRFVAGEIRSALAA